MTEDLHKRISYLSDINKELLKEITRFDMRVTALNTKLVKQQRAIDLLVELQRSIATTKSNMDFLNNCGRLITSHLGLGATYIYLPDETKNDEYTLLPGLLGLYASHKPAENINFLKDSDLPPMEETLLVTGQTGPDAKINALRKKFALSSFIISRVPVRSNRNMLFICGIYRIDHTMNPELNEVDIRTLEAVGVLISSYLRKTELIQLTEADRVKTEFVTNMSHEFRTPLTLITCLLEEIKNNQSVNLQKEETEKFKTVLQNTERIRQLIEQLLDITRLETTGEKLLLENHSVGEFLTALYNSFSSLAKKNKVKFSFSLNSLSVETWYDEDKLEKIVSNLLTNAFKYTRDKVQLSGEVINEGHSTCVVISVRDNGSGIPAEEQELIFNRFYRIEKAGNASREGTGIGLYFVKKLVELHRGRIELKSSNKGSEFIICIPASKDQFRAADEPAIHKQTKSAPENTSAGLIKTEDRSTLILVVEDNAELNRLISESLSETGRVISAFNGKEGFETAVQDIPDIIICDVMMPVMDGMAMLRNIRNNRLTRHIPVIMLTARAGRENKIEGLSSGADDYITKPFDTRELILKTRNQLERIQAQKENFRKTFTLEITHTDHPHQNDLLLNHITGFLKENCHDPSLDVEAIADRLNVSRTQLYRKTEALTGYKPAELLRMVRLKEAASMFRSGYDNVAQVMYRVGFNNQSHFSRIFRKEFFMNPSEYIRKNKDK